MRKVIVLASSEMKMTHNNNNKFAPLVILPSFHSSTYVGRAIFRMIKRCLVFLERTVRCSQTVQFFVMFNMFKVWFWDKMWCSDMFEVPVCYYVTRLVLEHTVWCSRSVWFFVMFDMFDMFDMFEVWFWAKMWCSEMFEVQCCCYVIRLVLEHTVWYSQTVQFFVMFDMFEV